MNGIVDPTLENYRDFATRMKGEFRDYHFQACLKGDDDKDYYLTYTIARMENRDFAKLVISMEPVWFMTTPSSKVIQSGEKPEIELGDNQPLGAMKIETTSAAFTAKLEPFEVICSPPSYRIRYQGKDVSVDLEAKSLGLPFWFGEGTDHKAIDTPSSTPTIGYELFCDMKGTLGLGGREVQVKGVCVHEHLIKQHVAWGEMGWQDWIWFVFEEMYGLIFEVHGGGYKEGGLYLREEKEYLMVRGFDIDHPQWAYSPMLQRHIPVGIKMRAHTNKGSLLLEGELIRSLPWRRVNKYKHAVTVAACDTEFTWSGKFTYKDGRTLMLKEGKGGDEFIANYNFAQ